MAIVHLHIHRALVCLDIVALARCPGRSAPLVFPTTTIGARYTVRHTNVLLEFESWRKRQED
jgi:hypothetical protein